MKCINRIFIIITFLLYIQGCESQKKGNINEYLTGKWEIILHDYRGYQKFSLAQTNQIEKADLIITEDSYYYEGVGFIDTCQFAKWKKGPYDTSNYYGWSIEFKYSKSELAKFMYIEPVNKQGDFSCYNECNIFFLKQDTLINICGGYTYYLVKSKN